MRTKLALLFAAAALRSSSSHAEAPALRRPLVNAAAADVAASVAVAADDARGGSRGAPALNGAARAAAFVRAEREGEGRASAEEAAEEPSRGSAAAEDEAEGAPEDGRGSDGGHGSDGRGGGRAETAEEIFAEERRESYALLFPWFVAIVGVFAYFVSSRCAPALPYAAVVFLVGTAIGFSAKETKLNNAIAFSAETWIGIEGEAILLAFLPGLLYLNSYRVDVRLFAASFGQLITFAFPVALAGASLTALVAKYVFPYGWSFDLCMTFGSILAATDPVAVAVLLNELGAPQRLKIHISGESLLNGGSAVVFYHIFSLRFLSEIGLPAVGHDVGWGEGFLLFFRLAFGGVCIGIAFGVGLLVVLHMLNRRWGKEDAVVQVVATIAAAYLTFFTSEMLAHCSGIVAVVFCGVTVKAFGEALYNDDHLSHSFWEITEYLLNTLLFALGGCVWGDIVSGTSRYEATREHQFGGMDWAYLLLLFVMVVIIRFFLVFAFYPITSRIGIGTNWRESVFMSYGGLRGAVGIALALSLHAEIVHITSAAELDEETRLQFRDFTDKLFGMVGGIALLTLVVNGPTSGPLLKKLGLVTPSDTRKKVVENYHQHLIHHTLKEYILILTEKRFQEVDFTEVKKYLPFLREITYEDLMSAVDEHKTSSSSANYVAPRLKNVIPYLYKGEGIELEEAVDDDNDDPRSSPSGILRKRRMSVEANRLKKGDQRSVFDFRTRYTDESVKEERLVFVNILRHAYHHLVENGELEPRGFIVNTLNKSLDFAWDAVGKGMPLSDWNGVLVASEGFAMHAEHFYHRYFKLKRNIKRRKFALDFNVDFFILQGKVEQIIAFTKAHRWARNVFKTEFVKTRDGNLTAVEKFVLDECDHQIELADKALKAFDNDNVQIVMSLYACRILLNRAVDYFDKLEVQGLMTAKEVAEFAEEIEECLARVSDEVEDVRTEAMTERRKTAWLSKFGSGQRVTWNLSESEPGKDVDVDAVKVGGPSERSFSAMTVDSWHGELGDVDGLDLDGSDTLLLRE